MTQTSEESTINHQVKSLMGRIQQNAQERAKSRPQLPPHYGVLLEQAGYPRRHRERIGGMYGPGSEKAKELLPVVMAGDCLLILFGERGPGKTQIATWWAAQRAQSGKSAGIYAKCADIFEEIKRTWSNGGKTIGTEHDVLQRYRRTPFLVIDEVHEISGVKSDWHQRTLINILDHRYDARRSTVLIANYGIDRIHEEINPSILSRAEETGGLLHCNWPSYRTQGV